MKNSLVQNSIIAILSISIFFGLLEIAQRVRYWKRYGSVYWLKYGFVPKPENYDLMIENARTGHKDTANIEASIVTYGQYYKYNPKSPYNKNRINAHGFRGRDIGPKIAFRIVALGGSTTYGSGVKDGDTYPERLSEYLNCEVINAGITEADINTIAGLFQGEIVALRPDIVIINSVANNFMFSKSTYAFGRLQKINMFFLDMSLFYMTLREKLQIIARKPVVDLYRATLDNTVKAFLKDEDFFKRMEDRYTTLIRQAKASGITVYIVKEPSWLGDTEKESKGILLDKKMKPVWDKTYALLDSIGAREDIMVITPQIPESAEYYIDGLHLTAKGNDLLAKQISDCLAGKLPAPPARGR